MSVLLIYAAVSRFSFLGGGVTAPSDFSFLVSRFSFLVSRFSFLGGGVTGPLDPASRPVALYWLDLVNLPGLCAKCSRPRWSNRQSGGP